MHLPLHLTSLSWKWAVCHQLTEQTTNKFSIFLKNCSHVFKKRVNTLQLVKTNIILQITKNTIRQHETDRQLDNKIYYTFFLASSLITSSVSSDMSLLGLHVMCASCDSSGTKWKGLWDHSWHQWSIPGCATVPQRCVVTRMQRDISQC